MRFILGYLDPDTRSWQAYCLVRRPIEIRNAYELRFGVVKVIRYPRMGYMARWGIEWTGFSIRTVLFCGEEAFIRMHVSFRRRIYNLLILPAIQIRFTV